MTLSHPPNQPFLATSLGISNCNPRARTPQTQVFLKKTQKHIKNGPFWQCGQAGPDATATGDWGESLHLDRLGWGESLQGWCDLPHPLGGGTSDSGPITPACQHHPTPPLGPVFWHQDPVFFHQGPVFCHQDPVFCHQGPVVRRRGPSCRAVFPELLAVVPGRR